MENIKKHDRYKVTYKNSLINHLKKVDRYEIIDYEWDEKYVIDVGQYRVKIRHDYTEWRDICNIPFGADFHEVHLKLVQNNGLLIQYIEKRFLDSELIWAALISEASALEVIPTEQLTLEMCLYAVSKDVSLIKFVPIQYLASVYQELITCRPDLLDYMSEYQIDRLNLALAYQKYKQVKDKALTNEKENELDKIVARIEEVSEKVTEPSKEKAKVMTY